MEREIDRTHRALARTLLAQTPVPAVPALARYTAPQRLAVQQVRQRYLADGYRRAVRAGLPATDRAFRAFEREIDRRLARSFAEARRLTGRARTALVRARPRFAAADRERRKFDPQAVARARGPDVRVGAFSLAAVTGELERRAFPRSAPGLQVLKTPFEVGRAFVEDPGTVTVKTLGALKDTAANLSATVVQTVTDPEAAWKAIKADYERRYGPLLAGDAHTFRERLKDEGVLAEVADIATVASAGSRLAGVGARSIGELRHSADPVLRKLGERAHRIGATERAPKVAPHTRVQVPQRYSRGVVAKGAQRTVERRRVARAQKLYRDARRAQAKGQTGEAAVLRARAQKANPYRVSERELRTRLSRRVGLAEPRRRAHRQAVLATVEKALPKRHADIALLLAQGIVRPARESLRAYRDALAREHRSLTSRSRQIANEHLRRQLDDALVDPALNLQALERAGHEYAAITRPLQRELVEGGALLPGQERMAKLIPIAVQEMGARWNPAARRLEIDGEELPVSRIEAYVRSTGRDPDKIAFVSHHPRGTTAGDYYRSWAEPVGITGGPRTGKAVTEGTFELTRETGRANVARMRGLADSIREYADFVGEFGYREGRKLVPLATARDAHALARELRDRGRGDWRPVALKPMFGRDEQARALLERADTGDVEHAAELHQALEHALTGVEGAPGYALVPEKVAAELQQHQRVLDPTAGGKAWRLAARQFSSVVLSTSPAWVAGNVIEAALRTLALRAGPGSYRFGRRVIRELERIDPEMGAELVYRIGVGHFGMRELQVIHTTARQFEGTAVEGLARGLGTARRTPVVKQIADVWNWYTRHVFHLNGQLEKQFKTAMLGREIKGQLPTMTARELDSLGTAVQQAARGLRDTNAQASAAEAIARAYGRYEGFSPSGRRALMLYTPFGAWTVNAARFLLDVLPRDHPITTGLAVIQSNAQRDWLEATGLTDVPGWLKGSVPAGPNWIRVARYTPFSLAADPLTTTAGVLLPQIGSIVDNFNGLDWKGKPLAGHRTVSEVTDSERLKAAAESLLSASVPFFGKARSAKKKPGGVAEKIAHAFNPFDPIPRGGPQEAGQTTGGPAPPGGPGRILDPVGTGATPQTGGRILDPVGR